LSFSGTPPHPITRYKKAHGLSQRRLGAMTGIIHVRIHALEHNADPRPGELEKLAAVFGCTVGDLQREGPR
jgi:transcriptional regulator with XRE-family HTH domain